MTGLPGPACRGDRDGPRRRLRRRFASCGEAHRASPAELCPEGCLGLGDCTRVCPSGALHLTPRLLPLVDGSLCVRCGACVEGCPRAVLVPVDPSRRVRVACRTRGPRPECGRGCLTCGACERACPRGSVRAAGGAARIRFETCTGCGLCAQWCPRGVIAYAGPSGAFAAHNPLKPGDQAPCP